MDYQMESQAAARTSRFEGRLFTDDGQLYFVIDVDAESGFAQVSYHADGRLQVRQMPLSEVELLLACDSRPLSSRG